MEIKILNTYINSSNTTLKKIQVLKQDALSLSAHTHPSRNAQFLPWFLINLWQIWALTRQVIGSNPFTHVYHGLTFKLINFSACHKLFYPFPLFFLVWGQILQLLGLVVHLKVFTSSPFIFKFFTSQRKIMDGYYIYYVVAMMLNPHPTVVRYTQTHLNYQFIIKL